MKKKLCYLVRHLSSSCCFHNHGYSYLTAPTTLQSHSNPKPYFRIPILPFSTLETTQTQATSTSTSTRKPVANYLTERLCFSEEQSLAISKKLLRLRVKNSAKQFQVTDLISFEKSDNVITFLQEYCGLDLSQVKKVITKHPRLLAADLDKTIKPKVKLLQHLGFSTSDLAHVLSTNPKLYLSSDLSPAIQALRGILGSDDKAVVKVVKKLTRGASGHIIRNLIPNVTMLENEFGIPNERIRKFLCRYPNILAWPTETSLRDVLVRMEDKWGISRDSTEFLRALQVFCCISDDNINSKYQLFHRYGWSDSDILSLIRRHPNCLGYSEAGMKKKLDFYTKELGYEPAYMASRSALFSYSLENRVVPRYGVLLILKEKGLIKAEFQFYSAIKVNESQFFDRFILPFMNVVPKIHQVYRNSGPPTEELLHSETSENECTQVVVE